MSKKQELDKYYTKPEIAAHCAALVRDLITAHQRKTVVEPSAGNGAFLDHFENTIAYDLQPEADGIIQKDFFDVNPTGSDKSEVTVLGNPPFGHASNLAIKFFNHATLLSNTIAFIIPKTFRKLSVQKRLNLNFHLFHEYELPKNSFLLLGKEYDVPCIFQIWQYQETKREIIYPENPYFYYIKKKDADKDTFCIRRVGCKAGEVLNGLDHSESSTYFVNPKIKLCRQLVWLMWISNDLPTMVCNTAAQNSIGKNELLGVIER